MKYCSYVSRCARFSGGIPVEIWDSTLKSADKIKGLPVEDRAPGELIATSALYYGIIQWLT